MAEHARRPFLVGDDEGDDGLDRFAKPLKEWRCRNCGRLLCRYTPGSSEVQIVCPDSRCKSMNTINPKRYDLRE